MVGCAAIHCMYFIDYRLSLPCPCPRFPLSDVLFAGHFTYLEAHQAAVWAEQCSAVVRTLPLRLLMSYIYGAPILDVSRSHTTTQHSR